MESTQKTTKTRIPELEQDPGPTIPEMSPEILEKCRGFVEASTWTFARSMPSIPHEYSARKQNCPYPILHEEYEEFILLVREYGVRRRRGKNYYTYLNLDGWRYWTMGYSPEATTIINRGLLACQECGQNVGSNAICPANPPAGGHVYQASDESVERHLDALRAARR
jgi:hypothetical protein